MRRLRDDSGQMMAALIIALAITLLAFVVVAIVPVGAATNEKTRSQTAADAAALAGADAIRKQWIDDTDPAQGLFFGDHPGTGVGLGRARGVTSTSGYDAAAEYAGLNDARVLDYRAVPGRGRVFTEVENTYAAYPDRGEARSTATAEMTVDFRSCRWSVRPSIPTLESTPPGPETFRATLSCGRWSARYDVLNSALVQFPVKDYVPGVDRGTLSVDLEPRLVD